MADGISANLELKLDITESVALGMDGVASDVSFVHTFGTSKTLNASSNPPGTKGWSDTFDLVAGVASLDLSALTRPVLPTVNATGLKVQAFKITAAADNTAGVTISDGAANGLNLFGDANGQITLLPGVSCLFDCVDQLDDVGATDKIVDFASVDADATITVEFAFG